MKTLPWNRILKDIIYNHTEDTIEFTIKDIENLDSYINQKLSIANQLESQNEGLRKRVAKLEQQLLIATLTKSTQKVSDFSTYA